MQVTGEHDDSRALNITIHKPTSSPHSKPFPTLQATFVFSDHIRCIIAKQRLAVGRIQARRMKMQRIAGEWQLRAVLWASQGGAATGPPVCFSQWPGEAVAPGEGDTWLGLLCCMGNGGSARNCSLPKCLVS